MTETTPRRRLPERALDTGPDAPWPVRHLSARIAQYVHRMPGVWVEGQVVQLSRRPGTTIAFLTLRDTEADVSLPVSLHVRVLDAATAPVQEGAHVVVHATPRFWAKRGTLQLEADEIRPVGLGELLARIEHLKRVLAAEGLFDAARKKPLPFLPHVVGLVCGRESKAEHDVVVNARARWPQVRFEIREVAVQGVAAVPEVTAALRELDADPAVEVIVVARGGGSVEDLLPFSNEALLRAAAACRTPLVSAIGHETDSPLLDLVADHRASTPTDAGKRVVPDVGEERARLVQARGRIRAAVSQRLHREQDGLTALRSRPVLARPGLLLDGRHADVLRLRTAAGRALEDRIRAGHADVSRLHAQVRALSPAATLERGYAVVQRADDGAVVRSPADAPTGTSLRLRLAAGEVRATATPDGTAQPTDGAPRFTGPRAGRRRPTSPPEE
ncbi:exodeoxyribonuclease VII large subunit [Actinotalea ferrariae CF5-4]|uniref:Exodeoxyribonuclease 7 large subunit n=1 Tax=Actinotalea ferrariae CF5-4 TaxID=948458 RepID=A0A021VR49_9CELL|nr:exodeoxyribonuclease VII large subunit [Actinotalea ferrariae]EYR63674.1 exodeoxyribonuclease VII large subunit [Actinotalea ferrariae CF5-4]